MPTLGVESAAFTTRTQKAKELKAIEQEIGSKEMIDGSAPDHSQPSDIKQATMAWRNEMSFRALDANAGNVEEPERELRPLQESGREAPLLRTILVVDDNEAIRSEVRAILERIGFTVQEAGDAMEALQKADTLKNSLAVLVTDAVMPGMSGTELAHILRRMHLELPVIFISGYPAEEQVHQLFERATFLQKPFSRAALINAVCTGLGTWSNTNTSKGYESTRY